MKNPSEDQRFGFDAQILEECPMVVINFNACMRLYETGNHDPDDSICKCPASCNK